MEIFPPGSSDLKQPQLQNGRRHEMAVYEVQISMAISGTDRESFLDQEARKANNNPGTNSNYFTSDEIRQSILGLSKASVAMETDLERSYWKKQNDICKAAVDNECATISDEKTQRRNGFSNICLACDMWTNKQTASQLILLPSPAQNFPANKQQQVLTAQITWPNYSNNNSFIEKANPKKNSSLRLFYAILNEIHQINLQNFTHERTVKWDFDCGPSKKHQQKEILSQSQDSENPLSGETFIAEDNSNGDKILASSCSSMNQTEDLENRENCKRGCCQACGSSSAQLMGSILGHSFSAEEQSLADFAENYGSKHGPCTEACCSSDPVRLDVSVFRPGGAAQSKMFQSIDEFDSLGSLQNQELRTHSPEVELIPRSDSSEKSGLGNVSSAEDDDSLNQEEETRKIEQLFQTYTEATLTRIVEIYSTSATSTSTTKQPQNATASARFLQPLSNQTETFSDSSDSSSFDENDLLELSDLEEFPAQLSPLDPSRSPGSQTKQQKRKRYIHKRSSNKRTHGAARQSLQQTVSQTSTTKTASLELLETFNTTGPASASLDPESPIKKHPSEDADAYPRDPKFRDFLRKCGSFEHDESSTIESDRNVYHPQISKRPWDAKLDAASPISSCESFPNPADKIPSLALRQSTEDILSSDSIQNDAFYNSNSKAQFSALGQDNANIHEIRVEAAESTGLKSTLPGSAENAEEPMWDFGDTDKADQLTIINQDSASYARLAEQERDVSLTSDSSDSLEAQLTKAESQVNTLRPHFRHATPDTSSIRVHPGSPASLNVDGSISNSQLSSSIGLSSKLSPRKLQGHGKLDELLRTLPATTLDEKIQMLTDENALLHTETFQNSDPPDSPRRRRSDDESERKFTDLADYEESFESARSSDSIEKTDPDSMPKNKFLRLDLFHAQDATSISSARVVTDEEINASGIEDSSPRISDLKQIGVSSNVSPGNELANDVNITEVRDESASLDECKGAMSSLLNICATKKLAASIDSAMSLKTVGSLATSEKQQSVASSFNETFANGHANTDNKSHPFSDDTQANDNDINAAISEEPKENKVNISEAITPPSAYTSDEYFRDTHKHSLDAADLEFEATTKARVLRAKSIGSVDFRNFKRQVPVDEFDRDELNVISLLKGVIDKRQASLDTFEGNGRNTNGIMTSGGHYAFPSLVPQDPVMARITVTSPRRVSPRSPKDKRLLPVTESEDPAQTSDKTELRETFSPMMPALIAICESSPGTSSIPQISPSREAVLISTPPTDNLAEEGQGLGSATREEAELRPLRAATNLMEARGSPNSLGSQLFRPGKKYLNFGERERSISSSAYSPEAEERSPLNSFSQQSNSNDETFLEPESGLMSSLGSASDFDALRQAHADQQDDHQAPPLYAVASTVAESLSNLVNAATVSRSSTKAETFTLPNGRLSDNSSSSSEFGDENENQELSLLEILNEGHRHKVRVEPDHTPLKYTRSSEQLTLLEILKEGEELQSLEQLSPATVDGMPKSVSPDHPTESATFSIEPETFLKQDDEFRLENRDERQGENILEEAPVTTDHQNRNSLTSSESKHSIPIGASETRALPVAIGHDGTSWSEFSHSDWFVNANSEANESPIASAFQSDSRYETFLYDKSKDVVKEYNVSVSFKLPNTSHDDQTASQSELGDSFPTMPVRTVEANQHASWSNVSSWHEHEAGPCSSDALFSSIDSDWVCGNQNSQRERYAEFLVDRSNDIHDMDVHISMEENSDAAETTVATIPEADMPTMDTTRCHAADQMPLLVELNAPTIETGIEQPQWHQCREFSNADFASIPCVTVSWHQAEAESDLQLHLQPEQPDTQKHREVLHGGSPNEAWLSSLNADDQNYVSAPSALRGAGMYAAIETDSESEPEVEADVKPKSIDIREVPETSSGGNGISAESVGYMDEPEPSAAAVASTLLEFEEFSEISPDDSTARIKFGLISIESSTADRQSILKYSVDDFGASGEQSPDWLKEEKFEATTVSAKSSVDIVVEDITFDDLQEIASPTPGKRGTAVPPVKSDEVSQAAHEDWEDWLAREVRGLNDPPTKTTSTPPAKQPPPRPPRPAVLTVKQVYDLSWLQKPLPRKTPGLDESSGSSVSSDEDDGGSRPGQGKKSVTWGDSTGMSLEVGPSPSDHSPIISPRSIIKNKLAAEEIARAQQLAAMASSKLDETETVDALDLRDAEFVEKELAPANVSDLSEVAPVESDASKLLLAAADLNNRNILAMLKNLQESQDNLQTMLQQIINSKTDNNHKITRETTIVNKATTSSKIETHVRPLVIPNIASSAVQTEGMDDYNGQIHGEPNVSAFGGNRDVDDVGPLPFLHSLDSLSDTRWAASSDAVWRIQSNKRDERLNNSPVAFSPAATDIYLSEYKEYLRRKKAELNEKVARYSDLIKRTHNTSIPSYPGPSITNLIEKKSGSIFDRQSDSSEEDISPRRLTAYTFTHAPVCSRNFEFGGNSPSCTAKCGRRHMSALEYQKQLLELRRSMVKLTSNAKY